MNKLYFWTTGTLSVLKQCNPLSTKICQQYYIHLSKLKFSLTRHSMVQIKVTQHDVQCD